MKINEVSPILYGIYNFDYSLNKTSKPFFEKSHYSYRLMFIKRGKLEIVINGKKFTTKSGDLIYMIPGDRYRFLPTSNNFSLINVFFDMTKTSAQCKNTCIFMQNFKPELLKIENFEDNVLNAYKVINAPSLQPMLESLTINSERKNYYETLSKSVLTYVLITLISNSLSVKQEDATSKILSYINLNPESDLDSESLSKLFSYHKNYINAIVKKATGLSLSNYVRKIKINHAKILIMDSNLTFKEISERLKYYDYSHFYKTFYKETGLSPTQLIK